MKYKIPDVEYMRNVRKEFSRLKGKEIRLSVFTHDRSKMVSYKGKTFTVGSDSISFEISKDDASIPVKKGDKVDIEMLNIHSFALGDKVHFFLRE